MSGKAKRRKWHKESKPIVFDFFKGTCQSCNRQLCSTDKWDIHHFHYNYNGKLYDTPALELIENKVITLLCRPCHDIRHTAIDPTNRQHLENKFPCEKCGKVERGIFDRKKNQNLDKLLCRDCFHLWRKRNPELLEVCENCGQKELRLTARKQSEHLNKLLCKLCFKQKRTDYLDRFEKCEVCGKFEGGLSKRKEKEVLKKLLCLRCFENAKHGVIQGSLFS